MEAFAESFRVRTPELPGHGDDTGPFSLGRAVDTVVEVVDAAPAEVHLVGISGGATVAMLSAAARPARVSTLVLSAPVATPPRFLGLQRFAASLLPEAVTGAFLKGLLSGGRDAYAAMAAGDFRRCGKHTFLDALRSIASLDARPQLAAVRAATVVVRGEEDRANAASSAEVAAHVPDASVRVVDGVGHLWNLEDPELFNRMLRELLTSAARQLPRRPDEE